MTTKCMLQVKRWQRWKGLHKRTRERQSQICTNLISNLMVAWPFVKIFDSLAGARNKRIFILAGIRQIAVASFTVT